MARSNREGAFSSLPSIEKWATQQRAALKEEREAERQEVTAALAQLTPQECQEKGVSLLHLNIAGISTGLYARKCISLGASTAVRKDGSLPAHGFGAGDEVVLRSMKGSSSKGSGAGATGSERITGVIARTTGGRVDMVASTEDLDSDLLEGWAAG